MGHRSRDLPIDCAFFTDKVWVEGKGSVKTGVWGPGCEVRGLGRGGSHPGRHPGLGSKMATSMRKVLLEFRCFLHV